MPEMQPRFTYSVYWPFTKSKKRIQKFKATGDSRYIYQNELESFLFLWRIAYEELCRI